MHRIYTPYSRLEGYLGSNPDRSTTKLKQRYHMENIRLFNDDCLNVLRTMDDNSIDSCVTDPPYGLSFMGKSWDYDVPKVEIWKEVYRVLKPGAHLLAFFGSRTYHRGVVQIEDAGFEIRDQIMWIYGSGFPKSHNIGKAIDKEAGAQRKVIGKQSTEIGKHLKSKEGPGPGGNKPAVKSRYTGNILGDPITEEAKQWEGWGTALKPAHEPIVVARKPITQTVAANVLEYGTGAINIDDCRVEINQEVDDPRLGGKGTWKTENMAKNTYGNYEGKSVESSKLGRWPANVIHDGSDEVVSQFPVTKSGTLTPNMNIKESTGWSGGSKKDRVKSTFESNTGSAARFFYCAKASKSDRETNNNHPTVKPTDLMKYLCRLVTPKNGVVLDPFMGSGSTGKAAISEGFKFVGIEMSKEYFEIAEQRVKLNNIEHFMNEQQ